MEGRGQWAMERGSALGSRHQTGHSYRYRFPTHVPQPAPSFANVHFSMPKEYDILSPPQGDMSQTFPSQPFCSVGFMEPIQAAWVSPERVSSPSGPSAGKSKADWSFPMGASSPDIDIARAAVEPVQLVSPMAATKISNGPPPAGLGIDQDLPPVAGRSKARLLGPLRTVQDSVAGLALNPFCASNMEFQRRGEDEISKLLHLVVQYASRLKLQIKYEDPQQREQGAHNNASRAVGTFSLDFRWLMKHLEYNRSIYSKVVFNSAISEAHLQDSCRRLRLKGDLLAHKQHLQDNLQEEIEGTRRKGSGKDPVAQSKKGKCGTIASISEFFMVAIDLARMVETSLKANIPAVTLHRRNLEAIDSTFQEFIQYRALHQSNVTAYGEMDKAERKQITRRVLDTFKGMLEDSEEGQQLIAVAFAARCNISIKDLTK